jgi:hypothetical protein
MKAIAIALTGVFLFISGATAGEHADCATAASLVTADYPLPRVAAAIAAKELNIAVIGSASSLLALPGGKQEGYPARLEAALSKDLPGVKIRVKSYAKPGATAEAMESEIGRIVATDKPALLIWQTGTIDAIRGVDPDSFGSTIEEGLEATHNGGSDIVLMNPQYSPRTESMISVTPYVEAMRFVALQHQVPLFDRYAVMRQWGELGTFDLTEITKKTDMAEQVHRCIAVLLADLIVRAARLASPSGPAPQ